MKIAEKSMGTVVKALKSNVKQLEAKMVHDHEEEIKKNHELVDSILAKNSDAIKKIDSEIQRYIQNKVDNSQDDLVNDVKHKELGAQSLKKCRYYM